MNSTDPLKSGIYTSEFWLSLVSAFVGLLIAGGVIHPTNPDALTSQIATIIGASITIFTTMAYIFGRSQIKASAVTRPTPSATVINTAPQMTPPVAIVPAPGASPYVEPPPPLSAPAQSVWTPDPGLTRQMPKTRAAAQDTPYVSPV